MLQIVIYKKLNFWEEYTPLNLTSDSTTKGTDNPEKTKYCLLINFERILHHASCTDET